jgi:hypothetical protein
VLSKPNESQRLGARELVELCECDAVEETDGHREAADEPELEEPERHEAVSVTLFPQATDDGRSSEDPKDMLDRLQLLSRRSDAANEPSQLSVGELGWWSCWRPWWWW